MIYPIIHNLFAHNHSGPLSVGELIRIHKIYKDGGIVVAKTYDVTTIKDMDNGVRSNAIKFYYIGTSKKMQKKWKNG